MRKTPVGIFAFGQTEPDMEDGPEVGKSQMAIGTQCFLTLAQPYEIQTIGPWKFNIQNELPPIPLK